MKIALAHDYLIQMGGAERVVAAMHRAYPEAPIYTSAVDPQRLLADFLGADIRPSWMQRIPGITRYFKQCFPLYHLAFRSFTSPEVDVLWISASTFGKSMAARPGTRTICYCHNPTRFLWDENDYTDREIRQGLLNRLARLTFPLLKRADYHAAQKIHVFIANSETVRRRILKFYHRESEVIHPPVNLARFTVTPENDGYYLIVSRLVGYRNLELAVRAFTQTGRQLRIIGSGPDRERLEGLAGKTVQFLGFVPDEELAGHYERCRALIVCGEEDFGISVVEAQACGKPVLAYGAGGALETVIPGLTGVHFPENKIDSLLRGLEELEGITWSAPAIRAQAEQFSEERFLEKMRAVINRP